MVEDSVRLNCCQVLLVLADSFVRVTLNAFSSVASNLFVGVPTHRLLSIGGARASKYRGCLTLTDLLLPDSRHGSRSATCTTHKCRTLVDSLVLRYFLDLSRINHCRSRGELCCRGSNVSFRCTALTSLRTATTGSGSGCLHALFSSRTGNYIRLVALGRQLLLSCSSNDKRRGVMLAGMLHRF